MTNRQENSGETELYICLLFFGTVIKFGDARGYERIGDEKMKVPLHSAGRAVCIDIALERYERNEKKREIITALGIHIWNRPILLNRA